MNYEKFKAIVNISGHVDGNRKVCIDLTFRNIYRFNP